MVLGSVILLNLFSLGNSILELPLAHCSFYVSIIVSFHKYQFATNLVGYLFIGRGLRLLFKITLPYDS